MPNTHIHRLTNLFSNAKNNNKNGTKKHTVSVIGGYSRPGCDSRLKEQKIVEKEQIFQQIKH